MKRAHVSRTADTGMAERTVRRERRPAEPLPPAEADLLAAQTVIGNSAVQRALLRRSSASSASEAGPVLQLKRVLSKKKRKKGKQEELPPAHASTAEAAKTESEER